jgi:curli biogenesis system outer membrane secretion channel CsgG
MKRLLALLLCALVLPCAALAAPAGPPTVAVIYFDYQGKSEELAPLKKGLASMLISDLAGSDAYRVVERERLEDVLGELKLQATKSIDQASAVKAGKLLGAQYLVLGSYFDVLKQLRIDARIVEVQTGRVLQSVGGTGKPEDFLSLEQKLATDLGKHLTQAASTAPVPTPVKVRTKTVIAKKGDAGVADAGASAVVARRAKPPKKLDTQTAVEYGRALSAMDANDVEAAKGALKKVMATAPDFELASLDLNRLMKQ